MTSLLSLTLWQLAFGSGTSLSSFEMIKTQNTRLLCLHFIYLFISNIQPTNQRSLLEMTSYTYPFDYQVIYKIVNSIYHLIIT
jgi:hypothetical protein